MVPDWYTAAHYCNWLSDQEGLPRDQWCYIPNDSGDYAEGMSIPADVLDRKGYRLPTDAEWEFACRAGTVTSRYYGNSVALLDAYAWYQANSKDHAWGAAAWCRMIWDYSIRLGTSMSGCRVVWDCVSSKRGMPSDHITVSVSIRGKNTLVLRGGSFYNLPSVVRSAFRIGNAPVTRGYNIGFRPSQDLSLSYFTPFKPPETLRYLKLNSYAFAVKAIDEIGRSIGEWLRSRPVLTET